MSIAFLDGERLTNGRHVDSVPKHFRFIKTVHPLHKKAPVFEFEHEGVIRISFICRYLTDNGLAGASKKGSNTTEGEFKPGKATAAEDGGGSLPAVSAHTRVPRDVTQGESHLESVNFSGERTITAT